VSSCSMCTAVRAVFIFFAFIDSLPPHLSHRTRTIPYVIGRIRSNHGRHHC
jgi:hypothetical protein